MNFAPTPIDPSANFDNRQIAYFSMEIALSPDLPTYSGGLGMLAGDTLRSAADIGAPVVAVSLAHRCGYFKQHLDANGQQTEEDVPWSPENLPSGSQVIAVSMLGREVMVRAWRFDVVGVTGHVVPVYLLDTDVDRNDAWDRRLTDHLYGGDTFYRLCQETILGIGGAQMIRALGYEPDVFHMNEGHASLLAIGLLEEHLEGRPLQGATEEDIDAVRQHCVFTTHTPVPAGHDQFGLDQMYQVLGHERAAALDRFGCLHNGLLNMTYVALRFSRFVNGVAMQHGKVSQAMFPEYPIHSITNGVHAATWLSPAFQDLFDRKIDGWRQDNNYFRSVYGIAPQEIVECHDQGKRALFQAVEERNGVVLNPTVLTLGFARRVATYKRAHLLFHDAVRLAKIAEKIGGLQILYAGKAHPADNAGKGLIRDVFEAAARMHSNSLQIVYLENYDWQLGALLTNGVDVWVNTPLRPYEASGTSGMKAALNGVPSLSALDGWWMEGAVENSTGWSLADVDDEGLEAASLYEKLEHSIAPMYYRRRKEWARMMQSCIGLNGSFFNTHRMLGQYLTNAYFPEHLAGKAVGVKEKVLV